MVSVGEFLSRGVDAKSLRSVRDRWYAFTSVVQILVCGKLAGNSTRGVSWRVPERLQRKRRANGECHHAVRQANVKLHPKRVRTECSSDRGNSSRQVSRHVVVGCWIVASKAGTSRNLGMWQAKQGEVHTRHVLIEKGCWKL